MYFVRPACASLKRVVRSQYEAAAWRMASGDGEPSARVSDELLARGCQGLAILEWTCWVSSEIRWPFLSLWNTAAKDCSETFALSRRPRRVFGRNCRSRRSVGARIDPSAHVLIHTWWLPPRLSVGSNPNVFPRIRSTSRECAVGRPLGIDGQLVRLSREQRPNFCWDLWRHPFCWRFALVDRHTMLL